MGMLLYINCYINSGVLYIYAYITSYIVVLDYDSVYRIGSLYIRASGRPLYTAGSCMYIDTCVTV